MNYYELLDVPKNATTDEIKKHYHKYARIYHPDKGGDPEKFKDIQLAYETLMDPIKRHQYDMDLNSSCITWEADTVSHIWDYFWENADYYMVKYSGIDRFLYHENITEKNHFPRGWFYSRHYGFTEGDEMIFDNWYYDPDYIVCMFNNFHRVDPELFKQYAPYDGMEKYWHDA